jgi:hypothetical protein
VTSPYGENPYTQQTPHSPTVVTAQFQAGRPPAPYGQLYGAHPREHPHGTLILIFGIIGIFVTIFAPDCLVPGQQSQEGDSGVGHPVLQ